MASLSIVLSGWAGALLASTSFAILGALSATALFGARPTDVNFGILPAFRFKMFGIRINIGWLQIGTSSFDFYDFEHEHAIEDDIYDKTNDGVFDHAEGDQNELILVPWKVALSSLSGIVAMVLPALLLIGPGETLGTIERSLHTMWLLVVSPSESGLPQMLQSYANQSTLVRLGIASAAFSAFNLLPNPILLGGRFIVSLLNMMGVPERYLMDSTPLLATALVTLFGFAAYVLYWLYVSLP